MRLIPERGVVSMALVVTIGVVAAACLSASAVSAQQMSFYCEGRTDHETWYGGVDKLASDMRADYAEFGPGENPTQFNVRTGIEVGDTGFVSPSNQFVHTGFYKTRATHPAWRLFVWAKHWSNYSPSGYDLGPHGDPTKALMPFL